MRRNGIRNALITVLVLSVAISGYVYAQHGGMPQKGVALTKPQSKGAEIVSKFQYNPLKWIPPKVERRVLPNGMVLFLLEDHELPLVNITSAIRTGSIYEPADKAGLAALVGHVMRSGGTTNMSAEDINKELEFMAAFVETSIGREEGSASLSSMTKDFDKTLKVFADILMHPAFPEDKIQKRKEEVLEAIRRENDNPDQIAFREFRRLLYEPHPYNRKVEGYADTIPTITREDMVAFHKRYFHPNNMIMGISGDFNTAELIKKLEQAFEGWKKEEIDFPHVPKVGEEMTLSINYVDKDLEQSTILLGNIGIERTNPDYFAVKIMNFILGEGSFTARIPKKVRDEEGLAYSVYSAFHTPRDLGFFFVSCQTKVGSTGRAIELILEELQRIKQKPVSDEELTLAKDTFINQFIFLFTTSTAIVSHMVDIEYEGLPLDYLDTYVANITAVTKEDVLRVAQEYLHPDKITLLVVGNEKRFDRPLNHFGNVSIIELNEAKEAPPL
ncbi:MAG TPA: M16 family metallopeptidase [Candidatus Avalokitesvara rifleensis]|uniref:M16 family metallopeptidase n=1 Tax=Candidatus Avalokitesvara rifleensis TaxID=3367620 RepID=UPI0040266BD8